MLKLWFPLSKSQLLDCIPHGELGVTKKETICRTYRLKLGFRTFIIKQACGIYIELNFHKKFYRVELGGPS